MTTADLLDESTLGMLEGRGNNGKSAQYQEGAMEEDEEREWRQDTPTARQGACMVSPTRDTRG